ncbi:MAG: O-antigen ligase family protein [Oceanospirillaceae bacterium]|nr:O-antigen ligase family protein [Oceanospirillaceae bacterium]
MYIEKLDRKLQQILIAIICCLLLAFIWHLIPKLSMGLLALIPAFLILSLKAPFSLCLAFICFSFFRIHEIFPVLYPLQIPQWLAVSTLFSMVFNIWAKKINIFFSRELMLFSFFAGLVFLGTLLATNRSLAISSFLDNYLKISVMVFAISWLLSTRAQFKGLITTMILCGLITSAATLYNKVNKLELVEGTRVTIGRSIGSMLGDPNDLALVLLFPAGFCLAYALTKGINPWIKGFCILIFVAIFSAIIATQSRGGLLGALSVCGLFAWKNVKNKVLILSLLPIVALLLIFLAGLDQRESGPLNEMSIDESAMGRIYAWQAAFNMALHHPFSGVGIDNFFPNYFFYSQYWDGLNHAVHSTWFGVLAETGFLGLWVFVAMIIRLFILSKKSLLYLEKTNHFYDPVLYANAQAIQAGLVTFCVSGSFLTMGFTWPIYILLSMTIALDNYVRQDQLRHQTAYR